MEASAAQRLHDTLAILRPKGKVGGLGMGSSFGVSKRNDDSLPKNPLYSRFVKEGQGNYSVKRFKQDDDDDEEAENGEKDSSNKSEKNEKKEKKAKKAKREKEQEEAEAAAAETEVPEKKKKHKRKRADDAAEESKSSDVGAPMALADVLDWPAAIKAALVEGGEAGMELKALRKAVLKAHKSALEKVDKADQKRQFDVALEACPEVTVQDGMATVVITKKKKKEKKKK